MLLRNCSIEAAGRSKNFLQVAAPCAVCLRSDVLLKHTGWAVLEVELHCQLQDAWIIGRRATRERGSGHARNAPEVCVLQRYIQFCGIKIRVVNGIERLKTSFHLYALTNGEEAAHSHVDA